MFVNSFSCIIVVRYYEISTWPSYTFISEFNWLFNNNNNTWREFLLLFFFFSFVSDEHLCFSIWSYICSPKHSREKNWPFLLLIVVVAVALVFVEWTFLTLIRGDSSHFLSLFSSISLNSIYFTFSFFLSHFTLRKNSLWSRGTTEEDLHSVRVLLIAWTPWRDNRSWCSSFDRRAVIWKSLQWWN